MRAETIALLVALVTLGLADWTLTEIARQTRAGWEELNPLANALFEHNTLTALATKILTLAFVIAASIAIGDTGFAAKLRDRILTGFVLLYSLVNANSLSQLL